MLTRRPVWAWPIFLKTEQQKIILQTLVFVCTSRDAANGQSKTAEESQGESRKKLHFSNVVTVRLIPTRGEFLSSGCVLHWTMQELRQFFLRAMRDLYIYASLRSISVDDAKKELYQPTTDESPHENSFSSAIHK
jgi:hypothetical protein